MFCSSTQTPRPVRLCALTRNFAKESLGRKYGKDTRKVPAVPLDGVPGFEALSDIEKYDIAIREIASCAPVRICKGEKISGAATLGSAIDHNVPATYNGECVFSSISHLTIDFQKVVQKGLCGIREEIAESEKKHTDTSKLRFLQSCDNILDSFTLWKNRYLEALEGDERYTDNYNNLLHVPENPPRSFYEAVQSIWAVFAFVRLCGNWPGIGRIDEMLGPFLERDLQSGALTLDEAREILAHFFIKGCEWICGGIYNGGDAQHYQNIVLGGVDKNGNEVTNEVTYLVLDIVEELGISDFPVSVRLNRNTPEKLLRRLSEVIKLGGGVIAVYNEELVIDSLTGYGYSLPEARSFANDGCWEVQVPGKTYFMYESFDSLQILQHETLRDYKDVHFASFEELFDAYCGDVRHMVNEICRWELRRFDEETHGIWKPNVPCTVVSVFEEGCIEKALPYKEGGPVYNVYSPHIGGFPDAVNSLYAIKKAVFDDKLISFDDFMQVLADNWQGHEELRLYVKNHYTYYGNDNDEIDAIANRLIDAFAGFCKEKDETCGYKFPPGISTFGRQLEWADYRLASPSGFFSGDVLAPNASPTPGTDREGATAIIKSYCKLPLVKMVTGAALDIRLLPSSVAGEDGTAALSALMRGFVTLGGYFMQIDVQDAGVLKEAQICPENYSSLSVRVSGWNARFVTLEREWQDMIIDENRK